MDNLVIEEQVKGLSFADDRLRQRYEQCLAGMQEKDYSHSFPNPIKDTYALKGFYRFINNTRVTQSTFIEGYRKGLVAYSKKLMGQGQEWFLIHDTMFVEYNNRELDLGYTQDKDSNGLLLHHSLLLDNQYVPLGLLHQQIIQRNREEFGKREMCKEKAIEDKESHKWIEGISEGKAFSEGTGRKLIHLLDREADMER
ncbi:MAG: hypothetical protein K2U26_16965 [Cyclobacteriaceae bacterium]|nr:hypothetical protein [Cyclobacteriaceae bacterium]